MAPPTMEIRQRLQHWKHSGCKISITDYMQRLQEGQRIDSATKDELEAQVAALEAQ